MPCFSRSTSPALVNYYFTKDDISKNQPTFKSKEIARDRAEELVVKFYGRKRACCYACHLNKTPSRRYAVKGRSHFAFSDVRRLIAQEALDKNFQLVCPLPRKPSKNTFAATFMRLAA